MISYIIKYNLNYHYILNWLYEKKIIYKYIKKVGKKIEKIEKKKSAFMKFIFNNNTKI